MPKKTIQPVQLMRPRSRFTTSRAAWASIAEKTGLRADQVKPAHTPKAWRWELKTASRKRTNPSGSTPKRKKASESKRTREKSTTTTRKRSPASKAKGSGGDSKSTRTNPSSPRAPVLPEVQARHYLVLHAKSGKRLTRASSTRLISEARDMVAGLNGGTAYIVQVVETFAAEG